jgi:hypothetical protein
MNLRGGKASSSPQASSSSQIERIKIYGERNTGTRFLQELLRTNFAVPQLHGGAGDRQSQAARERAIRDLKDYKGILRKLVIDRLADLGNERALPRTLGWKHMSPPTTLLKAMPEMANTLFIVIVKHPVFWALSYKRHPYHSYFSPAKMSFSTFIRHLFFPLIRDNVDAAYYNSVVELYAAKVDGYRALSSLGVPFELVRYEDLIADVSRFIRMIEQKYGLTRCSESEIIRQQTTKRNDSTTFEEFRDKYKVEDAASAVSREDYEFILSRFGKERLAWLGYPKH